MALSLLAAHPPRDLILRTTSSGLLSDVLSACASEGLCKASFADDVDRLYTLFDVCCDHGLGAWVVDYTLAVCLDPAIASNDPLESFMMDGACIVKWVERDLGDLRRTLLTTPSLCGLATAPAGASTVLLRFLARLHTMHAALDAIQGQQDLQHQGALLEQLCKVALWASGNQLQQQRALGVFASEQEWRSVVHKRREAAGGAGGAGGAGRSVVHKRREAAGGAGGLFLDRLLQALQQHHGLERCQYPPPSLDHALKDWFAHGSSTAQAATAKLQLLCYLLVDAGLVQPDAFARTGVLHMPGWQWQVTAGQCLLDGACLPSSARERLACQASTALLAGAGQAVGAGVAHALDMQTLEQLSSLGQHRAAVALLDTAVRAVCDVDDTLRALRLLLAEGRVEDALLRARADAANLPPDAVLRLMDALLAWCRAHGGVDRLLALPLGAAEEAAVLRALAPEAVAPTPGAVEEGDAAVGYLLARGRVPEALLLAGRVDAAVKRGGGWRGTVDGHHDVDGWHRGAACGGGRAGEGGPAAGARSRCAAHAPNAGARAGRAGCRRAGGAHGERGGGWHGAMAAHTPVVASPTVGKQVAVAPNAAAVGGAPAAPVVVQGAGDGPVPLVSHVLAPVWGGAAEASRLDTTAEAPDSMVFGDAPRALPMQTAAPAASMDDGVRALFASAPSTTRKQSKRARLAAHARAW